MTDRFDFIQDFTLKSLRLKPDKWSRMLVSDEQRNFLTNFVERPFPQVSGTYESILLFKAVLLGACHQSKLLRPFGHSHGLAIAAEEQGCLLRQKRTAEHSQRRLLGHSHLRRHSSKLPRSFLCMGRRGLLSSSFLPSLD